MSEPVKTTCLAVAASILASCTAAGPIEGPVRLGQIASVDGPRVRPERVIEDSRCPTDVQCVWAGRLVVRVTVLGGGWTRHLDLTLGTPVNVADGSLTLVTATAPRSTAEHHRTSPPYLFTFAFQGRR
jgi:hypothetical protein